jgi:hypothetical protein
LQKACVRGRGDDHQVFRKTADLHVSWFSSSLSESDLSSS